MAAKRPKQSLRELLAANLRAERARRGLTQEDLAALTGLHPTYISRVEKAGYNIGIDSIERFSIALGLDPEELLASR